ncbi:MAG: DUF1549 and DUF1553 domain-containing protein [Planctomycetia bacterium]|nr:DUF1549 and DUF1553 domain-containing protein [Planctomycetia bacterium]
MPTPSSHCIRSRSVSVALILVSIVGVSTASSSVFAAAPASVVPARSMTSDAGSAAQVVRLSVAPAEVVLVDRDDSAQLIVTAELADGSLRDVTAEAKVVMSKAGVVLVADARVLPVADGAGTLVVHWQQTGGAAKGVEAQVPFTVAGLADERRLNMNNDIVPILSKHGCNSGGCHGKASGQNGFRLSLFGFDAAYDFEALVKQDRGRRLSPAAPDRSLLLLKSTGRLPHGGGKRIEEGSAEYRLLRRWIVQGMPWGEKDDPRVEAIAVEPASRKLTADGKQQIRVVATYSDGKRRDVTREAEYKSQQPDIIDVDVRGTIRTLGTTGEGAVMVRYMGLVDVARVTVPFGNDLPADAYAAFQPVNFVDKLTLEKWKLLGIAPSPGIDDETFLRRAHVDLIGTLPEPSEIAAFLADSSPDKRARTIEALFERGEYAEFWSQKWGELLRNKRRNGDQAKRGTFAFAAWLRNAFAQNMPYDQLVRSVLTAQGNVSDNPPVIWYREVRNITHQVNDTAQLFLGTRINCANCHHHPYERWSQDDYWSFAAYFGRLGRKPGEVSGEDSIFVRKDGGVSNPMTNKAMKPRGLGGEESEYVRGEDPRGKLVDWMTERDNPFFAKAMVNRVWGHFMGIGLVDPVDDMRVTNPPSNPALMDALARDFVEHNYDIRHLIRTIMNSRTYQLSSEPSQWNEKDRQNYARYYARRLPAEVLLDAVGKVTDRPERFGGLPQGTRAIGLPDEGSNSYFLEIFGRSIRETPCECGRSYEPSLSQLLHLMNSQETQNKIGDSKGRVGMHVASKKSDDQFIVELYLRAFGRSPRADEMATAQNYIKTEPDRKSALEDIVWSLLCSKEFMFNR